MLNPFTHRKILRKGALGDKRDPADQQMREVNPAATEPDADDVVSQIERLDALRQSGALTREEFEREKRRLLG